MVAQQKKSIIKKLNNLTKLIIDNNSNQPMKLSFHEKLRTILRNFALNGGLVISEMRSGEVVICELIVRNTNANLGYNANQKVRTFYAIKRGPYM